MPQDITPARVRAAWIVALTVDFVQALSAATELTGPWHFVVNAGLDTLTMLIVWALIGWHFLLLPSFVAEALPFVDLAPTWTLAVATLTRLKSRQPTLTNGAAPAAEMGESKPQESLR